MNFHLSRSLWSIKTKVMIVSVLTIMAVVGGMATYFIMMETALLKGELKKRAMALVENFARNCNYPLLLEDEPAIGKLATTMMKEDDILFVRVTGAGDRLLFYGAKGRRIDDVGLARVSSTKPREVSIFESNGALFISLPIWPPFEEGFISERPARDAGQLTPLGRATFVFSLAETNAAIMETLKTTLLVATLIAMAMVVILMVGLRRFITPLLVLVRGIRELSAGRLSHRVNITRGDELGELAGAFNDMAQNLEKSRERLEDYNQNLEETVRWRTEALAASEARYRAFFESTGTAMAIIEEDGVISLVNAEFEKMFGYARAEVEGRMAWAALFTGDEAGKMKAYLDRRGANPQEAPAHEEFRVCAGDGRLKHAFATISPVPGTKKRISSLIDISDRKRFEEGFQQLQKMEAVGTLAGGIAHDFNNLLMGIQGYASLMLLNTESRHPHFEYLKMIEQTVQSGADLTRQLLAFARGGKYEIKTTDLNGILEKTSLLFGRTKKEIRIEKKFASDLWSVDVDRGQIEQVLMNLYVNAWHAMPGGGDLTLETANVVLPGESGGPPNAKPGDHVKVSVMDTGVGMDEKTKSRIFEPFFTTKEMGRGTGLGLATVYGIVQGHGGAIAVESQKGHGASFHIYLPASKGQVVRETDPVGVPVRGKETLLIVDDEEMILGVSEALATRLGYRVVAAKSGREAVEIYRERGNEIDAVILDMVMPGMNGKETLDLLKGMNPEIRVIFSSGYSLDSMASEITQDGCRAFIQKPFTLLALSQKIREALDAGTCTEDPVIDG